MSRKLVWIAVLSMMCPLIAHAQATRPARGDSNAEMIKQFDKDGDGKLSPEERQAARKKMQEEMSAQLKGGEARRVAPPVPPGVKAIRDVEYANVGGSPLLLDIYAPEKVDRALPVIVWIHGGGWRQGSKNGCPVIYLSTEGFALVSIDYRLSQEAKFPAQIADCKAVIRWIRANAKKYNFDPDRIGVYGSSAGGHLVALLGTSGGVKELEGDVGGHLQYSSKVQAVCDFFGPTTLERKELEFVGQRQQDSALDMVRQLLGGDPDEKRDLARLASPISFVSKDDPPFLIVHGDKDQLVPLRQSQLFADALKKAGVDVTLHVVAGAGHGQGVRGPAVDQMVADFFATNLKASASQGATTKPVRPATGQREKKTPKKKAA